MSLLSSPSCVQFSFEAQNSSWLCYCLKSTTTNATYVGQTKNFARRFREHKNKKRSSFVPLVCVEGLPTQRSAIQLERSWKRAKSRAGYKEWKRTHQMTKCFTRILDLFFVLNQEKWTKLSPPTSAFNLKIVCFDFVLAQNPTFLRLCSSSTKVNSLSIEMKNHFSIFDILEYYKNKTTTNRKRARPNPSKEQKKKKRARTLLEDEEEKENETEKEEEKEKKEEEIDLTRRET